VASTYLERCFLTSAYLAAGFFCVRERDEVREMLRKIEPDKDGYYRRETARHLRGMLELRAQLRSTDTIS
jgi:hypothetical protein